MSHTVCGKSWEEPGTIMIIPEPPPISYEMLVAYIIIIITSSFARSATSPLFAYCDSVIRRRTAELQLPDCVRFKSAAAPGPIASASTAAPRLRPLPAAAPRLRLLRLLLSDCMHPLAAPLLHTMTSYYRGQ